MLVEQPSRILSLQAFGDPTLKKKKKKHTKKTDPDAHETPEGAEQPDGASPADSSTPAAKKNLVPQAYEVYPRAR